MAIRLGLGLPVCVRVPVFVCLRLPLPLLLLVPLRLLLLVPLRLPVRLLRCVSGVCAIRAVGVHRIAAADTIEQQLVLLHRARRLLSVREKMLDGLDSGFA